MLDEYDDPNEKAKQFLRRHGKSLLSLIIIVFLGLLLWTMHAHRVQRLLQQSSGLYSLLLQEKTTSHAALLVDEIQKIEERGLYSVFAHFHLARLYFSEHDLAHTKTTLLWLVEHAPMPWSSLAVLRASSVMVDMGEYDQALSLIKRYPMMPGFKPLFLMQSADIYLMKHDKKEALSHYYSALHALQTLKKEAPDYSMDTIVKTFRSSLEAKLLSMGILEEGV